MASYEIVLLVVLVAIVVAAMSLLSDIARGKPKQTIRPRGNSWKSMVFGYTT